MFKEEFLIIAGPCAIENEEQVFKTAEFLKSKGVKYMRAGAYKPRTSSKDFQGLKEEGLKILKKIKEKYGLKIVTELMDIRDIEKVAEVADIIQIGSRNMQNFPLLTEVGKLNKPILLKRGFAATIDEWIKASEYISDQGNKEIIFCERGIRTFETKTRNTLDLSAIPLIKQETNYKILADPSHASGRADLIIPLSKAAKAIGADGLLIEVHPNPSEALCDGKQSLNFYEFEKLLEELK